MSKISDDARKMKQYLEDNGWIQGNLVDYETNSVCLVGSMTQSGVGCASSWFDEPVMQAIGDYVGVHPAHIPNWNDQLVRTQEQIMSVLEDVAIKYADDAYNSGSNNDTV